MGGHSDVNLVSWQTAFWTLIPLAINTMTQTSGRICGHSSRYRTYIRALPLLCAFDVLSIALQLIHRRCFSPREVSIRRTLDSIFRDRFVNSGICEDGIQKVENLAVVRWVVFILGTAPPAVKIMGMSGVPWTKAWAMMYLISFLVVEAVVVLRKDEETSDFSPDQPIQEETGDSHNQQHIRQQNPVATSEPISGSTTVQAVDTICFYSALVLQVCILVWALLDLGPRSEDVKSRAL